MNDNPRARERTWWDGYVAGVLSTYVSLLIVMMVIWWIVG